MLVEKSQKPMPNPSGIGQECPRSNEVSCIQRAFARFVDLLLIIELQDKTPILRVSKVHKMTNRILQTDIELAKKLIQAGRPDSEVAKALTFRRIDHHKAEQLVAALKAGQEVAPEMDVNVEAAQSLKARRSSTTTTSDQPASAVQPAPRKATTPSQGGGKGWVVGLIIFLVLASVVAFFLMRSSSTTNEAPGPETPSEPGAAGAASPGTPK
jgi:hypothetical protein